MTTRPYHFEYLLEFACSLCARHVTTVRVRSPRTRVLLFRPLRCQACGGGAVHGDTTLLRIPEPSAFLTDRPRRGRPPKQLQEPTA